MGRPAADLSSVSSAGPFQHVGYKIQTFHDTILTAYVMKQGDLPVTTATLMDVQRHQS